MAFPSSIQRVREALSSAGILTPVQELPSSTRTALEAATALGCRIEQIAKSLVFRRRDDDQPVLIIASGGNRVDEGIVSGHLGAGIVKADAAFVRAVTGFAIGGIPPVGLLSSIETIVDADLLTWGVVWAAAGTPHAVVAMTPRQLVTATGGRVLCITANRP